jgi:hypothetical protein
VALQEFPEHFQPLPVIDTSDKPAGRFSLTVMAPVVAAATCSFATVMVQVAPCWPWTKFPAWVPATLSSGTGRDAPAVEYEVPDCDCTLKEGTEIPWLFTTEIAVRLAVCE